MKKTMYGNALSTGSQFGIRNLQIDESESETEEQHLPSAVDSQREEREESAVQELQGGLPELRETLQRVLRAEEKFREILKEHANSLRNVSTALESERCERKA